MDSYVGLRHAPLPAPAAIAMHINQRGTSSPSPLEREIEEGGMKQTFFQKARLTYFMAHYECLASAPSTTH